MIKGKGASAGTAIALALLLLLPASPAAANENPKDVTTAIHQALAPLTPTNATITIGTTAGASVMPLCATPLTVTLTGVQPYQNAATHCPAPPWTLYTPITITTTEPVIVTTQPIPAGQMITQNNITLQPEPSANLTSQAVFHNQAALTGATTTLSLPAGAILTAPDIQSPLIITAGQPVIVNVQSGSVEVSINAIAEQAGHIGDTIMLTNPSSGKRFNAVVTADGPVVQLQP